jgi:hypothetical protein
MLLAACGLGALAGVAFAGLWLLVVPHAAHRRFWVAMHGVSREMLQVDEFGRLLLAYRQLGAVVGGYVARNFAGTVLAALPALALLFIVASEITVFTAAFAVATLAAMAWPRQS